MQSMAVPPFASVRGQMVFLPASLLTGGQTQTEYDSRMIHGELTIMQLHCVAFPARRMRPDCTLIQRIKRIMAWGLAWPDT